MKSSITAGKKEMHHKIYYGILRSSPSTKGKRKVVLGASLSLLLLYKSPLICISILLEF